MSINAIMGNTYSAQLGSINFSGLAYVIGAQTFNAQPYVYGNQNMYMYLSGIPVGTTITVGNYIVGPNIPNGTQIVSVVSSTSTTGIYQVSKAQIQGGGNVSANVAVGIPYQYGQVVATAPQYISSNYAGQLDFYAPSSQFTLPQLSITNGNVNVTGNLNVNGAIVGSSSTSYWSISNGNTYLTQGNLGIQNPAPAYTVDISGSSRVTGNLYVSNYAFSSGFITNSDYRIKENIENIREERTIDVLRPVEYDLKGGNHDMGFIAHEVQEQYPFLVCGQKDGEEIQALNYTGIIALLVKEIQGLKREIREIREIRQKMI